MQCLWLFGFGKDYSHFTLYVQRNKKRSVGSKWCFFKFGVEVGVEQSIVNEPLVLKTLIFK
jgi:hypothetical protein